LRLQGLEEYTLGNVVGAQRLLEMALELARQKNDEYLVALIQDALGDLYQNRLDFNTAEQAYMKAVDILRNQPEHVLALAVLLRNMGAVLSGERRFLEASTFYEEAARVIANIAIDNPQLELQILNGSGVVYFHQGEMQKAKRLFVRALHMRSAGSTMQLDRGYGKFSGYFGFSAAFSNVQRLF
jgi:tetratricopeptide (TPR) repeat protein